MTVNEQDIMGRLQAWFKNLPKNLKVSMVATYVIGLIAHGYAYSNLLTYHDAAVIYVDVPDLLPTIAGAAAAMRWMQPLIQSLSGGVSVPWLCGMIFLFFYGISAYFVSEALEVKKPILVVLLAGLLVTSPTATMTNLYVSMNEPLAIALCTSAWAVYAFYHTNHNFLWTTVALYICGCMYSFYLDFAIALFLVVALLNMLRTPERDGLQVLKDHLLMVASIILAMVAVVVSNIGFALLGGMPLPDRVERIFGDFLSSTATVTALASDGATEAAEGVNYLQGMVDVWKQTIHTFLPTTASSIFQGRKIFYAIFLIGMVLSVVLFLYLLLYRKVYRKMLTIVIMLVDVLLLPLAMNFMAVFSYSSMLYTFPYIIPWIFMVGMLVVAGETIEKPQLIRDAYQVFIAFVTMVTIFEGALLSNSTYIDGYNKVQVTRDAMMNLIHDIESVDGYVEGETPVCFVGNVARLCDYSCDYSLLATSTITYEGPFSSYLTNICMTDMKIGAIQFNLPWDAVVYAEHLYKDCGLLMDQEGVDHMQELMDSGTSYPKEDCVFLSGQVLVVYLGE